MWYGEIFKLLRTHKFETAADVLRIGSLSIFPGVNCKHTYIVMYILVDDYDSCGLYLMNKLQLVMAIAHYKRAQHWRDIAHMWCDAWIGGPEEIEDMKDLKKRKAFEDEVLKEHIEELYEISQSRKWSKYERYVTYWYSGGYTVTIENPDVIEYKDKKGKGFEWQILYGWDYKSMKWWGDIFYLFPSENLPYSGSTRQTLEFTYKGLNHGVYNTARSFSKRKVIEVCAKRLQHILNHGPDYLIEKYRKSIEKINKPIYDEFIESLNQYLPQRAQKGQAVLF